MSDGKSTLFPVCCLAAAIVDGELRELSKTPITDNGVKKSAVGFLRVDEVNGEYVLRDRVTEGESLGGALQLIFKDGQLMQDVSLQEVRAKVRESLDKVMAK